MDSVKLLFTTEYGLIAFGTLATAAALLTGSFLLLIQKAATSPATASRLHQTPRASRPVTNRHA